MNAVASHIKSVRQELERDREAWQGERVFGDGGLRRNIKAHQSATSDLHR